MALKHQMLVDGMHCPSCVKHIEELLSEHQVGSIVVSLFAGTVSFTHAASLDLKPIYRELEDAGFKALKPEKQTSPGELIQHPHTSQPRPIRWLESMLPSKRHQRRKHREVCEACRAEDAGESLLHDHKSLPSPLKEEKWMRSTFSVEGMTCGSCVSSLKAGLQDDAIRSVEITLIPGRAIIEHDAQRMNVEQLEELIGDLGYEPSLDTTVSLDEGKPTKWQAKLSVTGMTCASCTGSVKHALEQIDGASDITIDLTSGLATLTLGESRDASLASEEIKDIGFDCEVIEVKSLSEKADMHEQGKARTVRMRVDGMFCHECIGKVNERFEELTKQYKDLSMSPVTLRSPFTIVSYLPSSSLNLRTIRKEVWDLGFGFMPAPLDTIEQRAARARARERRGIFIRLIIALLFAVPTFVISVLAMSLLPSSNSTRKYFEQPIWGMASRGEVVMWALATPVQFGVGAFFYTRSWKSLRAVWRRRRSTASWRSVIVHRLFRWGSMDTLVALGTTLAYFSSVAFMVLDVTSHDEMTSSMGYFDTSVFLIFFILAGRYLEAVSKQYTGDAVSELNKTKANKGLLFTPGDEQKGANTEEVEAGFLEIGDLVLVPAGASPPLDGILTGNSSSTSFDESTLTGEARPVLKKAGDTVYAGTINRGPSAALVELTSMSGQSMVDGIASAVRDAMSKKAGIERVADTITAFFVPAIVGIACFTFAVWVLRGYTGDLPESWLGDDPRGGWALFALEFAIAVLVVACPCGIGLAAPTAQLVGVGLAAKHGILPNGGGEAFQAFSRVDTLVIDKTGTLTTSNFQVANVELLLEEQRHAFVWSAASAVEAASSHPLSVGLRKRCEEEIKHLSFVPQVEVTQTEEIAGRGLFATVKDTDGQQTEVIIGNEALMTERGAIYQVGESACKESVKRWQAEAKSVIFMAFRISGEQQYIMSALFSMQDPPRAEASAVIAELKKRGITTWMCTGDNKTTARAIAARVGIEPENVVADALPNDKRDLVYRLQQQKGKRSYVAFCGDGINDSPALAQADAGIAMGGGSAVALKAAHFALVGSSLLGLVTLRALSRSTIRKIYSNFAWASLYNCALTPLAAGAFYELGQTRLPAVWASLAMALSSVSVVTNSLFLRILFRTPKMVREWHRFHSRM